MCSSLILEENFEHMQTIFGDTTFFSIVDMVFCDLSNIIFTLLVLSLTDYFSCYEKKAVPRVLDLLLERLLYRAGMIF